MVASVCIFCDQHVPTGLANRVAGPGIGAGPACLRPDECLRRAVERVRAGGVIRNPYQQAPKDVAS